jgi:hypothetical protein
MNTEETNSEAHYTSDPSTDFFEAMEKDVNSMVAEEDQTQANLETTPQPKANNKANEGSQRIDWKKRYQDSSREAKKMYSQMQGLAPYANIIEAMKKDGGLVDHVRGYLEKGGSNQSIQEKLGLDEDFEFDAGELGDPKSDSSKVLNAHVDEVVAKRLTQHNQGQAQQLQKQKFMQARMAEEAQFRKNHPDMSDDEYKAMLEQAGQRKLSLEDIHYIINRDSANNKVAMNVKKDMVGQMKKARDIPASTSGLNSAPKNDSPDNNIFDALKGVDEELDNLFG